MGYCKLEISITARRVVILSAMACLLICVLCATGAVPETKPAEKVLKLDFATTRNTVQGPLVDQAAWDGNWFNIKDQLVALKLPHNLNYEGHIYILQIKRDKDKLTSIGISFDPMSIDDAYALALKFAGNLKLPKDSLKEWKTKADAGHWDGMTVHVIDNHQVPAIDLHVTDSYQRQGSTPARVVLDIGWVEK